jgi:mono/diheme cytochrome c family protein
MRRSFVPIAFCILLVGACAEHGSEKSEGEELGKKVYELQCVFCHGKDGRKARIGAAELPDSDLSLDERILLIANGRNKMPPYNAVLTKEEIEAVAEYTLSLK